MPDAQVVATRLTAKYLLRRNVRSTNTISILKAGVGQLAYGVQKRLVCLKRDFHATKDAKTRTMLGDCALRHEEMILRIIGHPLPGRARVTNAQMRTLDIEPVGTELVPPPEPMDSGMDSPSNGHADSLGNSGEVI